MIPLLPLSPLFVPDLPGYGASPPTPEMDKQTVGNAIMDALKTEVSRSRPSSNTSDIIPVVLIGHDRGARVAHRLAVSGVPGVSIQGVCLIDIVCPPSDSPIPYLLTFIAHQVPTSTQWQHHANPSTAAAEVTGYFHWPLLANTTLATRLISAFGPGAFCTEMIHRWAGSPSSPAFTSLSSDSALPLYAALFSQPGVLEATCADYAAGAGIDVDMQTRDQEQGRKINCPVLLLYSEKGIGSRFKFPDVWHEWVAEGVRVRSLGLGEGIGHFGAEEGPEQCAREVGGWLGQLRGE